MPSPAKTTDRIAKSDRAKNDRAKTARAGTARAGTARSDTSASASATGSIEEQVQFALDWLRQAHTQKDLDNLARFGIDAPSAYGVSMSNMQALAKQLGRSHALAAALWKTEQYEARMVTSFVDEPALVSSAQMDRWCREFDNWAICDTICFHLFDRTRQAWAKVAPWAGKREEFIKRAAFALLASLAAHDKSAPDQAFLDSLPLIERAAADDRNFVKKGVNWALRAVGRRNAVLNKAALVVAKRLAESADSAPRWVGKDALRELSSPKVQRALSARAR